MLQSVSIYTETKVQKTSFEGKSKRKKNSPALDNIKTNGAKVIEN